MSARRGLRRSRNRAPVAQPVVVGIPRCRSLGGRQPVALLPAVPAADHDHGPAPTPARYRSRRAHPRAITAAAVTRVADPHPRRPRPRPTGGEQPISGCSRFMLVTDRFRVSTSAASLDSAVHSHAWLVERVRGHLSAASPRIREHTGVQPTWAFRVGCSGSTSHPRGHRSIVYRSGGGDNTQNLRPPDTRRGCRVQRTVPTRWFRAAA